MAIDLIDFVPALKREVQPPGTDLYTGVDDADWVGYLADAFWEARLDGFMPGYITDGEDEDVTIEPSSGTTDLPRQYMALVILYAGVKVLRNRILNTQTQFRAKAGSVEFEQQNSATMLAEMLKQLKATKDRIIEELSALDETGVIMLDAYSTRVFSGISYYGAPELSGG
jgi:hypothetical protein